MGATMKRQYTNKHHPCPICGNHHGCAIREDSLIECLRSFSSQDSPAGYRFIKPLRNDMGGLFVEDDGSGCGSQKATEEWSRRQQERIQIKVRQRLSIEERDRQFRLVLQSKASTLSSRHSSHLLNQRQLTADEIKKLIELGWVRTWEPGIYAPHGVKADLPGISPDGQLLGIQGIALAALDPDGHITGMQIATLLQDPKYIWLSGANHGGNGPQLPNGELPLFCWKHLETNAISEVWLCEGALKSLLVAIRLWREGKTHIAVIGTAAAARYGKQTLRDYLSGLGAKTLRLMPDAGAVINPHIAAANQQTLKWLGVWDYQVSVGWWEQYTKDSPDIDELEDINALAYLTPDEFLKLIPKRTQKLDKQAIQNSESPEPDLEEYAAYVQWETEQEAVEVAIEQERTWNSLKTLFANVKGRLSKVFKGFGIPPLPAAPKSVPTVIDYIPGQLPTHKEYQALRYPKIRFKAGERLQLWQEAVAKEWQHILDTSEPGLGKSHTAGIALPNTFDVEKLWYFAANHRNPTTATVEANYKDLPVRHAGMKRDRTHHTPLGNDWIIWPRKAETPDVEGNCFRQPLFAALREKNILGVSTSSESPICQTCHLKDACQATSGHGFGFRHLRAQALRYDRIRAHPDSAPVADEFDYLQNGAFWDEAGSLLKPMQSIKVSLADFDQLWGELENLAPEIHEALRELRLALRSLLAKELAQPYYGFDDAAVRSLLPTVPLNLPQLIRQLEAYFTQNYSAIIPGILDLTAEYGVSCADLPNWLKRQFRGNPKDILEEINQKITLYWLIPFLKVWNGEKGALRCDEGKLTIFGESDRSGEIAKANKFNIYLDATTTPGYLGLTLKIAPSSILVIEQAVPTRASPNLKVVQITGMGQLGKDRSDSLKARVCALKSELTLRHQDIQFIDWKALTNVGEGAWFVDTRGSNAFMDKSALASFGIPYQNLGYLQALYQTLTGLYVSLDKSHRDPDFQAFIDHHTRAEIVQSIGRLRAHNRRNEQLAYYFVGDYDLSFLDSSVEKVAAVDIAINAGTKNQQMRHQLLGAYKYLIEQGQKITQAALAAKAEISQGRISQIASLFGGWKVLKKILAVLLNQNNSSTNNLLPLDETQKWVAQSYIPAVLADEPQEAISEVTRLVKVYGLKVFLNILAAASIQSKAKLLGLLIGSLPPLLQQEFLEIVEGSP